MNNQLTLPDKNPKYEPPTSKPQAKLPLAPRLVLWGWAGVGVSQRNVKPVPRQFRRDTPTPVQPQSRQPKNQKDWCRRRDSNSHARKSTTPSR